MAADVDESPVGALHLYATAWKEAKVPSRKVCIHRSSLGVMGLSSPSISVLEQATQREGTDARGGRGIEPCPVCGHAAARVWLQAPDRFHGRHRPYTLVRCPACELVWLSQPPPPEEMGEHYTGAYHRLISDAGETATFRWRDRRAALIEHKQTGSLLDLGCSSGSFLEYLKNELWKLYGIEMSADCAKVAAEKSGAQVFVGDIVQAPFPPESFDVITCFDVLEHLYEPRQVMAKVKKWLKPGGIFYVLVPNIDSAEARVFKSYWGGLELPRHLFHYAPASLRYLAKSVGLQEVSLETRRNAAVGVNIRYFFDDLFRAVGISRTPQAYLGPSSLPWRVARKLVRMTVLRFLLALAPLVGGGESIHAVFGKDAPCRRGRACPTLTSRDGSF
jgi:2-polyprenyl-3-methyl-5-hydroxy-6-metoxy-1,4-benzoquinol methylase